MTKEKICWLAGFINADGFFGAFIHKTKNGKRDGIRIAFSITNYDRQIIHEAREIMGEIIGRNIKIYKVYHAKARNVWVYRILSQKQSEIKKLTETVYPYLIGERKERAKILLTYLDQHKFYANNTDADFKVLEKLRGMTTKGILAKRDYRKFFREGSETMESSQ